MDENRPYIKRINLGIDMRNPDYKKAYEYICQHKNGKYRFICDCVLQVMEGRTSSRARDKNQSADLLAELSANPELLSSLAQAVAQVMPNIQQGIVQVEKAGLMDVNEESEADTIDANDFERIPSKEVNEKKQEEEKSEANPNEEEKEDGGYDGPILDLDMLSGLGAWDEMLD